MESRLNQLSSEIISAAIEVHQILGPGLLENSYQTALAHELKLRRMEILREVSLPVSYKGLEIRDAYRIDLVVNNTIILELKAVQEVLPIHKAQLLTYIRLAQKPLGLLLNFHAPLLRDGISRLINKSLSS